MQKTDRSVSYPQGENNDDRGRSKNSTYRLPRSDRQKRAGTADRQRQSQSEGHQDLEVQDGGGRQVPSRQLHPQPRALHCRRTAGPARRRHRAQSVGSLAGSARFLPRGRSPCQRGAPRLDRQQARTRARGDLNITAVWGTGDVSEKPVGFTDVRVKVDMECEGVPQARSTRWSTTSRNGRRSPTPLPARSISRSALKRTTIASQLRSNFLGAEGLMGSLAVSRLAVDDGLPSASIADQVALIARKNLAPQAFAIDEGTVYPDELLRSLGDVGAWGSHQPENGAADLRCAIQSIAALGEVCGATAFMAWCQNTLVWYARTRAIRRLPPNSPTSSLRGKFSAVPAVQPDEEFLRHREAEIERPQGRGRLCRQGRAALGLKSRPRPFFRHHLRARG